MPVHIRHGSPGSFKTAAAVWFDVLGWLRDGRTVYTNIRGMVDAEEVAKICKIKLPDTARVIVVDTDSEQERHRFACWFHWLPIGAAICIDEAQFIYPPRRDFKPETLDYPGGLDAATASKRPADIFTAIDKHRHYNWDVCLTTPSISKIPAWLRSVVESAYHHRNMEHLPLYGKRKARIHRHDASSSGTTITKTSDYSLKKIPVRVHELYGSTITGTVTANRASNNPLKNPRLLGFLGLFVIGALFSAYAFSSFLSSGDKVDIEKDNIETGVIYSDGVHNETGSSPAVIDPSFKSAESMVSDIVRDFLFITATYYINGNAVYLYKKDDSFLSSTSLNGAGYQIKVVSKCEHHIINITDNSYYKAVCPVATASREPSGAAVANKDVSLGIFN